MSEPQNMIIGMIAQPFFSLFILYQLYQSLITCNDAYLLCAVWDHFAEDIDWLYKRLLKSGRGWW